MPLLATAKIRPLKVSELSRANEWALLEGWNPGPHDSEVFFKADPGSLITVETNGCPVGVVSSARMTPSFGFLGFFVLSPEYRKAQFGWHLMQASLERLGDRTMGGEGTLRHLRSYSRYGLLPYYHTHAYQGIAPLQPALHHPAVECAHLTPFSELAAYDEVNFGASRADFLRAWLALPRSRALVFKQEGRVCGFGAARRCQLGIRVGPLQADTPEIAAALFDALVGLAPGELVSIDCPETNTDVAALLRKRGLVAHNVTARLFRGPPLVGMPRRIYAQMSFALG